jgi:hypothetical protein
VKISEGNGKYGVMVRYSGGGTTTYFFQDRAMRDKAFKRIKGEVTKDDKVMKKDR